MKTVGVFGLGYVGTVTAACLASLGHRVVGVDVNAAKVEAINKGKSPVIEPGLEDLVQEQVAAGRLVASTDAAPAVASADVCLLCVGTPSDANGGINLDAIDRACGEIGRAMRFENSYKVIAVRSTLLPGTLSRRIVPRLSLESGKHVGDEYGVATNPEFLREGSAIADFRRPPFSLIGEWDERAGAVLAELYADIAAPLYRTAPDVAAMVKYASNAYHALKVVYANEIGQLCKKVGIDSTDVMEVFCQDTHLNISPMYLRPGFAFGGSCLPKDLRALLYLARHTDTQLPVIESIVPSNVKHITNTAELILNSGKRRVAIVGLSFKPNTDDLRESPVVQLVETLSGRGLDISIWDQNVNLSRLTGRNKAFVHAALPHIEAMLRPTLEEALGGAEVVVVAHRLKDEKARLVAALQPEQLVVDLVKLFDDESERPPAYEGICW